MNTGWITGHHSPRGFIPTAATKPKITATNSEKLKPESHPTQRSDLADIFLRAFDVLTHSAYFGTCGAKGVDWWCTRTNASTENGSVQTMSSTPSTTNFSTITNLKPACIADTGNYHTTPAWCRRTSHIATCHISDDRTGYCQRYIQTYVHIYRCIQTFEYLCIQMCIHCTIHTRIRTYIYP